jgi:hypothetical protein
LLFFDEFGYTVEEQEELEDLYTRWGLGEDIEIPYIPQLEPYYRVSEYSLDFVTSKPAPPCNGVSLQTKTGRVIDIPSPTNLRPFTNFLTGKKRKCEFANPCLPHPGDV